MHRVYKEADPHATIARLRGILAELGITPYETTWIAATRYCHAVRIEDMRLPIGTNGKGVSRPYALASAYAELLERLQVEYALIDNYGLMTDQEPLLPDVRVRPFADVARQHAALAPELIAGPLPSLDGDTVRCAPFYNVMTGQVEELPLEWIAGASGSNGCCAGNTPEEALVQGLGEVVERHAMTELYLRDGPAAPSIALDGFDDPWVQGTLRDLRSRGYEVIVKDCTLGGRVPALATLLVGQGNRYSVHFAASPMFETALERCLTETFQGAPTLYPLDFVYPDRTCPEHLDDHGRRVWELTRSMVNGRGAVPERLAFGGDGPIGREAFLPRFEGHRHALRFMVDMLRRLGCRLYLRDVSFLGFPAYRVYVPEMMQQHLLNRDRPLRTAGARARERRLLMTLPARSRAEVLELARVIEHDLRTPAGRVISTPQRWLESHVYLDPASDYSTEFTSTERLLVALFLRAGEHGRAAHYLTEHLEQVGAAATTYERCCLGYLRLRAQGVTDAATLVRRLAPLFGAALADEVATDLGDPEQAFQHYQLPRCGDCAACPVQPDCKYEDWRPVNDRLRAKAQANRIDQEGLRRLFE
jgi:ribosomal protein S12 methylthiotransferase accessory factor